MLVLCTGIYLYRWTFCALPRGWIAARCRTLCRAVGVVAVIYMGMLISIYMSCVGSSCIYMAMLISIYMSCVGSSCIYMGMLIPTYGGICYGICYYLGWLEVL
jgi:hypothetical protein